MREEWLCQWNIVKVTVVEWNLDHRNYASNQTAHTFSISENFKLRNAEKTQILDKQFSSCFSRNSQVYGNIRIYCIMTQMLKIALFCALLVFCFFCSLVLALDLWAV
jgi:hypothetical protein